MEHQTVGLFARGEENSKLLLNKIVKQRISEKAQDEKKKLVENDTKLNDLPPDCLEKIASYLDVRAKLNMLYSNKRVYSKLVACAFFWKHLCQLERLDKLRSLSNEDVNKDDEDRLAWSGELLHSNETSDEATRWQKIYQRGVQMRRNLTEGRYEMWRLFMTDQDNLPVKKMSKDTQPEDLEILHNLSPYNDQGRRVRVNRYWNEEFLVVMQYDIMKSFHDIFVWRWQECQKPVFLYSHNLLPSYPSSLFPTSFFMHKNFFVLMPDTGFSYDKNKFTSMVRVHDLSDGFKLVGKFDFDEDSGMRRHKSVMQGSNETAHLHRLGDKAVALCRTPDLTVLIFSIPDCKLEKSFKIKDHLKSSYEHLELDQRFMMKDNTMMFMFHDPDFFHHLFIPTENPEEKYGRLLSLDFDAYVQNKEDIKLREDQKFDVNTDFIEKISLDSKTQLTCILSSGKIVVKDLGAATSKDLLSIEVTEPLQETYDEEADTEVDSDGPSLSCGPGGDLIIAFRHFVSGRKIHAYNKAGSLLYEINVDDPMYELETRPGFLSVDLDGNFLVAADQSKVVIFNSKSGAYVRTIVLPPHYNTQADEEEDADRFCWKGHTDFAFSEDGIIVIHSQRNFPIAADVLLFW